MKLRRIWTSLSLLLALLVLGVYIGIPFISSIAVVLPDRSITGEPPENFIEVTLITRDNVLLAAWYAAPQNGVVIIIIHGAGDGRDSVRSYGIMLQENGFGVLVLNLRGYGDSGGQINRLGWNGTSDVGAAVEFLMARHEVKAIGGLGISLGGEVLLGAASAYPVLRAIAADGATFRTVDEYMALPGNVSLVRNFTAHVHTFFVGLLSGDAKPSPLLDSIIATETTTYLFIAAEANATEVAFNKVFHQATKQHSTLWVIPGVGHTEGFNHNPDEYERRVVEFFGNALL
jgi:uncharacterized protein